MDPRAQAHALILHLVEAAGDRGLPMKTALYKAFYWAHVYYYRKTGTLLTRWDIARMPDGPGIDEGADLLSELVEAKLLSVKSVSIGYPSTCYHTGPAYKPKQWATDTTETKEYREAVREAVAHVKGRSASDLSDETHAHSQSWKDTPSGGALDIVRDAITDEEARETEEAYRKSQKVMQAAWHSGQ